MRNASLILLIALTPILPGCGVCEGSFGTYIPRKCFEATVRGLDEDGDGVTKDQDDCNDADANAFPGNPEVPYNGHDEDCDPGRHDLIDVDGDGYPGISQADWEASPTRDPSIIWPSSLFPEVDCRDDDDKIFPGAVDAPYDGVDADCAGDNDFDNDCDGYIPSGQNNAFASFLDDWGYDAASLLCGGQVTPVLGQDDCDDFDPQTHPGVTADPKGNGIDANCDCDNDLDADDDGWMPPETAGLSAQLDNYIASYGCTIIASYGDCLDTPHPSLSVDPASVHPQAPDTDLYDGVDSDCDPLTTREFDADADGWIDATSDIAYTAYLTDWGLDSAATGEVGRGDCDDSDPSVYPTAIEILGDATDQDCDTQINGTHPLFASNALDRPHGLRAAHNDQHFLLSTVVDVFDKPATNQSNVGIVYYFDGPSLPTGRFTWQSIGDPLGEGFALLPMGDGFITAVGQQRTTSSWLYLKRIGWSGGNYVSNGTDTINHRAVLDLAYPSIDLSLSPDGATLWAVGCGIDTNNEATEALRVDLADFSKQGDGNTPTGSDSCIIDPSSGSAATTTGCTTAGCNTWSLDTSAGLGFSSSPPSLGATPLLRHRPEGLLRISPTGGALIDEIWPLFGSGSVTDADFTLNQSVLYAVGVVDGLLLLEWGDPAGTLQTTTLSVDPGDGRSYTLSHVAIAADDSSVMIGFSLLEDGATGDDRIGWMFLNHP